MIRYSFGTLRFIDIYSVEDKEDKKQFDSYIKAFELEKIIRKPFDVIGSINGMEPIICIKQNNRESIMKHCSSDNSLLPIAENLIQLNNIINKIKAIWDNHQNEMFLKRNEQNLEFYNQFVIFIHKIKNIDSNFWIDFAFKELDIRYEV